MDNNNNDKKEFVKEYNIIKNELNKRLYEKNVLI